MNFLNAIFAPLVLIFKGIILGCTAIIPGISIGTMALVLNVYEKAIEYLNLAILPKRWTIKKIIEMARFFVPLVVGIVIAMITLATLLSWLLEVYPSYVKLSFLGIILGSLPYIYSNILNKHIQVKSIMYIAIGAAVVLFFAFSDVLFNVSKESATEVQINLSTASILLAVLMGTISSACGLIPGISGSFVLLIIGYYSTYLNIIKTLNFGLLIPLLIGHMLGFILTAVGLKILLNKFPLQSHSVIFGMILASALAIFPWDTIPLLYQGTARESIISTVLAISAFLLGIVLALISVIGSKKTEQ